jgi:hypothetical protein
VGNPDAALAQMAPKHVVARRLARAACDVGLLRVALIPPSAAQANLSATMKDADSTWRAFRPRVTQGRSP